MRIHTKRVIIILLICWSLIELYPLIFMFNSSLKNDTEILKNQFALAIPPSFDSYAAVWQGNQSSQPFYIFFANSMIILIDSLLLLLTISTLAGYALARGKFPGSAWVQQGILLSLAVPAHTLLIPLFFLLGDMGLRNSNLGISLVYATLGLPFSVILVRAYFVSFPVEIEEQALIDGCTRFGAFWRLVVPMSTNILATVAIVNIAWIWSELFFAQAFLSDTDAQTLPIAVASYQPAQMQASASISQHFAIMSLTSLPLIVLYFVFQRHIRKGMTAGALR